MPIRSGSDDEKFLESLRPLWEQAQRDEDPPPETLARAFALYDTHPPARRWIFPIFLGLILFGLLALVVGVLLAAAPSVPGT